MQDKSLGCEGAGGEIDVVGPVNKGVAEFADNFS